MNLLRASAGGWRRTPRRTWPRAGRWRGRPAGTGWPLPPAPISGGGGAGRKPGRPAGRRAPKPRRRTARAPAWPRRRRAETAGRFQRSCCTEGLETAIYGTHERPVEAPCQQGDAGNADESDPTQVFELCRQRREDIADQGIQGTPFNDSLSRVRSFGPVKEVGIVVSDAVIVAPDGNVARREHRQKEDQYNPGRKR